MSSSYHPQTDGQSEVLNRTLEMYLRCFCFESPKSWLNMLPWAQYWYNTSYHTSIKMSPYKALYGRDPPSLVKYEVSPQDELSLRDMLEARDKLIEQLKQNLQKSQHYMKHFADKKRRFEEFQEGDLVLVKLQPYRQQSLALRKHQKIGMRFFGPFTIIHKLSSVAYRLELPQEARIHPIFHISLLKKFRGDSTQQYLPLPLTTTEFGPVVAPTQVLAMRTILQGMHETQQVQVQWGEGSAAFNTWENAIEFLQAYPQFNLEDKVGFKGEGIVRKENKRDEVASDVEEVNNNTPQLGMMTEPNSVSLKGQVEHDQNIRGLKRSTRQRATNVQLRDYVC